MVAACSRLGILLKLYYVKPNDHRRHFPVLEQLSGLRETRISSGNLRPATHSDLDEICQGIPTLWAFKLSFFIDMTRLLT